MVGPVIPATRQCEWQPANNDASPRCKSRHGEWSQLMTEQALPPGEAPETVDFDALYRGDFDLANRNEQARGAGLELDCVPWDIGGPQPVPRELDRPGQSRSESL